MYLAVDVGGSKTLLASLDDVGSITESRKFPTPQNYPEFLKELADNVDNLSTKDFTAACIAIPGRLDRDNGIALELGNLTWKNIPVQADCEKIFGCPTLIENDANLAGLSEALLKKDAQTVLYVTVSTGIGTGIVYRQRLDPALLNSEGGHLLIPHRGKLAKWESFASGRAIYEHFGKYASDIPVSDEAAWKLVARNLAVGFFELIAINQPDLIIIGGSIGTYFERYSKFLINDLKKYEVPLVHVPKIIQAQRPEEAVVYGCYDLARQTYGAN